MPRILLLAVLFALELTILSLSVDGQNLINRPGVASQWLAAWGAPILHFLVSLAALGVTFTYLKRRAALQAFSIEVARRPWRFWMLAAHLTMFGGLLALGQRLYQGQAVGAETLVPVFVTLAAGVFISGLAAMAPLGLWRRLARSVGLVWAYAAGAAAAAVLMTSAWRAMWRPAANLTYALVQLILRPLVGQLIVEPEKMRIATPRFGVIISPECSGLEGMGLLLLFGIVWLWLYRDECRFPQALVLLPAGLGILYILNSVRIATLILIGHAGARQIAAQGFHSQAGWIAFNGVAFGLCIAAGRIPWIAGSAAQRPAQMPVRNPVALYLGPFLAILAAGMLTRSMTGVFEWLYPLRFLALCAVLWAFRHEYRRMNWRFTWRGPAVGLLVFGVWMGMEWALYGSPAAAVPAALRTASPAARWAWILFRILGAVVAAPIAEELAFRGYLMRRLLAEDFEQPPVRFKVWALIVSSALFGAMHGARWLAGAVAGIFYGAAYARKGELGEAVTAHMLTNALIAAAVLWLGYWKLW